MIARVWQGTARPDGADAYVDHLSRDTLPLLRGLAGFEGGYVLRRDGENGENGVDFLVLTLWESHDAVRAFAGDDLETAVVPPEAQARLARYDRTVSHYEVAVAPARAPS